MKLIPTLTLLSIIFASCKKQVTESENQESYPEPCEKTMHIVGTVKDSISHTPIEGLEVSCVSMGEYTGLTNSEGVFSTKSLWQPCGKIRVPFDRYGPTIYVIENENYCSPRYIINAISPQDGDTAYFDLLVNTPSVLRVNFIDTVINGNAVNIYGIDSTNAINLQDNIDTTLLAFVCPNWPSRISIYSNDNSNILFDTLIKVLSNDTSEVNIYYP